MEVNQQANCYNCFKPLPERGYFCGKCLTQVRCKSCNSLLEEDNAGCLYCGTPREMRVETEAGSNRNINTFRLYETATDRTIEATFSDDVAKDLAGTLRDAAAAGRIKAIGSNIPPSNSFDSTASEQTDEFAEAEVVDNRDEVAKIEAIDKSAPTTKTVSEEEYPTLRAVSMKNLPGTETEWIVVYAFYSSNYGNEEFSRQNIIERYSESNRKNKDRMKGLSAYITNAVKGGYINPLENSFSILDKGIQKAKEIIARTTGSSPKPRPSSKPKKENKGTESENEVVNNKKAHKASRLSKRLSNINFEPEGKVSLKDFFASYTPANDSERNLLFVYYLQGVLEVKEITFDHVYSCYDILGLRISENLPQTIRNTASKTGWIETNNSILAVTVKGSNQIKAWNKKD
ncbi:zinc ribbon domain-containing protein [Dyadobacter sp. CY326]|uniref:zinc ribbon domain-containing protein n=1 Tax=Dyadobacter sp. CY326 TaxID=2907300 RepID=UPI001F4568BF|nr:zinc ribbon domain-containing protein [Dyadobacter sp. CY326]MCE7067422.1 hypothetical protein [Dyadobacter sp. CY326]